MGEHDDVYRTEHFLAWLMAALAIALGVVGALEAFGLIDIGNSIGSVGEANTPLRDVDAFQDGVLFLVPSLVSAFLALTLHRADHHVRPYRTDRVAATTGNDREDREREQGFFTAEHIGAYVATLAAIAMSVVGIIVGFNLLDDAHSFYDGLTWELLALMSSILAATLHSVGHHQPVYEPDGFRARVEDRVVDTDGTPVTGATRRGIERR